MKKTDIEGVVVVDRPEFADERGFFKETFRRQELKEATGVDFNVVQENHARSKKGTLRGIHTAPWNKLIYVPSGEVQIVIVDFREDSKTFGQHYSIKIGDNNRVKIFIPKGCGNSYLVLSEEADYLYLTDDYWVAGKEFGIAWDDPDLNIKWELSEVLVSDRDKSGLKFREKWPEKSLA